MASSMRSISLAQIGERGRVGAGRLGHGGRSTLRCAADGHGEIKENVDSRRAAAYVSPSHRLPIQTKPRIAEPIAGRRDEPDGRGRAQHAGCRPARSARRTSRAFAGRAFRRRQAAASSTPASSSRRSRSPTRPTARSTPTARNAVLVCHALTGDQHVANVHPVTGKPRLVGDHGRPRQADRHRALFRHLPERGRRLHGHDRPGLDQSGDRQAVGPRFSGHHHPRHGAGAGDAARSSRHRHAVRGRRRLDGRHAGAAMGGELSASACSRRCRSPARRGTRRRTSRSTRSAARR